MTLSFTGAMILYEICQLWMPQRTFDLKDIVASVLGGLFSYLVFRLVNSSKRIAGADQH
ncbi:VanZ family protein [Chitinophaga sp. 22321]